MPNVSVIVPTYNRANFIKKTLQSVLEQTYSDFELIVVDDYSSDGTEAVVASMKDPRIKYLRHTHNQGAPTARNTGIRAAYGVYIAFLDSDDTWSLTKLQEQLRVMQESKLHPALVYTGIAYVTSRGELNAVYVANARCRGYIFDDLLLANVIGTTSTALVAREVFNKVGFFDETLPSHQDYDLWLRIARHYPIDFVPMPLTQQIEHDEVCITTNLTSHIEGRTLLLKKLKTDVVRHPKKFARQLFELGTLHFEREDTSAGRRYMSMSLRRHPIFSKSKGC